ncbi:Helix-turn-helix domain protein [compost metagenome]|jgi:excisionase family DNA binding protein
MRSKKPFHIPQPDPKSAHLFADGLLTIPEAAKFLSVCRATVYNLLNAEELISVGIGRSRRIPKRFLIEFAQRHVIGGEKSSDRLSY